LGQRSCFARARRTGDSKIDQIDEVLVAAGVAEQHVGRLDIAVDQPVVVRSVQGSGDLTDDVDCPLGRHRPVAVEGFAEVLAFDQSHVQEKPTVDLAVGVDRDDMGFAQPCGYSGLAPETLPVTGVVGQALAEQFEGHDPVMGLVIGPIDLAHPAAPEHALDPIWTELLHGTPIHDHTPDARSLGRDAPQASRALVLPVFRGGCRPAAAVGGTSVYRSGSLGCMKVSVGELTFDVTMDGPADGRPVLLLHGFPETGRSWDAVRESLVRAGHRVIVPDQRGYSSGARPPGVEAYGMRPIVADAIGILDALRISTVDIVGHDWGANVAWCLATWHPERVRSLTAVAVPHPMAFAWAFHNDSDQRERSSYIRLFWIEGKAEKVLLDEDARRLRAMLTGLSAEAVEHYVSVLSEPGALTATLNWYRAMNREEFVDMPPVSVPTTYVWSTQDLAVGQAAAQKCGEFVDATYRFVILDGVSHWIPEHAPDQLTAAILDQIAAA